MENIKKARKEYPEGEEEGEGGQDIYGPTTFLFGFFQGFQVFLSSGMIPGG